MKSKTITAKMPHFIWPPPPTTQELRDLAQQRKEDISIKGKSGPIRILEEKFLEYLDMKRKYCVSFNSGTSGLLAAYFAMGIDEGDEVIGPAITFHAALSPVFILKANPVLADIQKDSRCIDPLDIERRITPRTKAITVVHQWGHPADMDKIMKIASKYNLKIVEDCSHAHGSKYKGQKVGTFGDIAVFSLQAAKMLFAGEGGLLVTDNVTYHDRATLLGHYRDRSKEEISDSFYNQFWVSGYGLKLRMSPYNAVTAIHSLEALDRRINERKKCLTYFIRMLKKIPEIEPLSIAPWADMGAWYGFKPLLRIEKLSCSRDVYISFLKNEGMDIDVPSAPILARLPLYYLNDDKMFKKRNTKITPSPSDFPQALYVEERGLSLPTFTDWKNDKPIIDQYIKAFEKASKKFYIQ